MTRAWPWAILSVATFLLLLFLINAVTNTGNKGLLLESVRKGLPSQLQFRKGGIEQDYFAVLMFQPAGSKKFVEDIYVTLSDRRSVFEYLNPRVVQIQINAYGDKKILISNVEKCWTLKRVNENQTKNPDEFGHYPLKLKKIEYVAYDLSFIEVSGDGLKSIHCWIDVSRFNMKSSVSNNQLSLNFHTLAGLEFEMQIYEDIQKKDKDLKLKNLRSQLEEVHKFVDHWEVIEAYNLHQGGENISDLQILKEGNGVDQILRSSSLMQKGLNSIKNVPVGRIYTFAWKDEVLSQWREVGLVLIGALFGLFSTMVVQTVKAARK
jgi:hypothetical protein